MTIKASMIQTITLTSPTPLGLDKAITDWAVTRREDQLVEIRFAAAPGFFAAIIVYTG